MKKIWKLTYPMYFSDESLKEVKAELEERDNIRKENLKELNKNINIINQHQNDLPAEIREAIASIVILLNDIDLEQWTYSHLKRYSMIGEDLPNMLPLVILKNYQKYKVKHTQDKIKASDEYALYELLQDKLDKGWKQKDMIKEYGGNEALWSRVKEKSIAKKHGKLLEWLIKFEEEKRKENPFPEPTKLDIRESKGEPGYIGGDILGRKVKTEKELDNENMEIDQQEWAIAEKLYKLSGQDKAVAYLQGRIPEPQLQKFKANHPPK